MHRSHFWVTVADMGTTRTTQKVAANVRAELAARRIKSAELADAIGVSLSTVYRWLSGETPWSLDHIEATAEFFGMSVERLLSDRSAA